MTTPRRSLGPLDRLERRALWVGVALIAAGALLFAISWTASDGIPFRKGPEVAVLVPDAAQLTKGDEARVGGARIGRVRAVHAQTLGDGRIVARVLVRLDEGQPGIPADSTSSVVPINLFGAKALKIVRGRSARTISDDAPLGVDRSRVTVDLSDVLADVDSTLASRVRTILGESGTALAGRGDAIAEIVPRVADLLPPARRVARRLASPATRLGPALAHLDDAAGIFDGLRAPLPPLLTGAARTVGALRTSGPAVEATLDRTPRAAATATRALRRATPVLADLRALVVALEPGVDRLPGTVRAAEDVVDEAGRTLAPGTGVPGVVRKAARLVAGAADLRPDAERVLGDLRDTSAPLERTMTALGDAEIHCNTAGLLARNLTAGLSGGDRAGAWLTGQALIDPSTLLPAERQAPDLHLDPYPRADAGGCASANQLFRPGRHVGPAPHDDVNLGLRAPAAATERARHA
ncbi:MlaD family protein, partial [Patulibacter sp. NPDC049589]|uniref:MlaD family protein n=1 Tax=Patulibacter sp. NPDC049589 TaxID=3154731 RepID=UPI0034232C89